MQLAVWQQLVVDAAAVRVQITSAADDEINVTQLRSMTVEVLTLFFLTFSSLFSFFSGGEPAYLINLFFYVVLAPATKSSFCLSFVVIIGSWCRPFLCQFPIDEIRLNGSAAAAAITASAAKKERGEPLGQTRWKMYLY